MSDRRKEAEEKMAKAIFISADCWLCVFDLLPAYQLGLGIALISHRFDYYIDEHFKTRKWALKSMELLPKYETDGTWGMKIVKFYDGDELPIPQIELPRKVIGFECIIISYIDQNAIAFLRRFRQLFAACQINLAINTKSDCILKFILRNVWPMLGQNIHGLETSTRNFHHLRQFVPSILNECTSLRLINAYYYGFFAKFPCDDSATASDGQAVAKWLFTPRPDIVPKVLFCSLHTDDRNWSSNLEPFKAAFASASSPANFIIVIWFHYSADFVVPFELINELTREQLALKATDYSNRFLFVRSPIERDESKWAKWEKEAIGWECFDQCNQIYIRINENKIGDGLLDATPGPSDQQQK
ncbi:hypothetical protein niasHT_005732 [Heterodera trifolii]|uniref:Uncharacterized protein n=1 Tax=Heterodera trifolii TaxID=157864 RepID=A0ABD2LYU3_9BILA